jgi:hypothetical protein
MIRQHVRRDPGHGICNVIVRAGRVVNTVASAASGTPLQAGELVHEAHAIHEAAHTLHRSSANAEARSNPAHGASFA